MSLNIKNKRVLALAREAARATGQSQTGVIEQALIQYLERAGADPERALLVERIDTVRAIAIAYSHSDCGPDPEVAAIDDLYDADTGLPR